MPFATSSFTFKGKRPRGNIQRAITGSREVVTLCCAAIRGIISGNFYLLQGRYVYLAFVCLFVCLSVCLLLATSCHNYYSDLHKNVTKYVSLDKEVPATFWKSTASGYGSRRIAPPPHCLLSTIANGHIPLSPDHIGLELFIADNLTV